MNHAEYFIKEKIEIIAIKDGSDFETIVVSLETKYAGMLEVMAKRFNFSTATSLSEIMSKHLFDMVVSLNDDDFKEFKEKCKYSRNYGSILHSKLSRNAIGMLYNKNIITAAFFKLPVIK
jgi:hypothetical protein